MVTTVAGAFPVTQCTATSLLAQRVATLAHNTFRIASPDTLYRSIGIIDLPLCSHAIDQTALSLLPAATYLPFDSVDEVYLTMSDLTPATPTFLGIPLEVRNAIYEELFAIEGPKIVVKLKNKKDGDGHLGNRMDGDSDEEQDDNGENSSEDGGCDISSTPGRLCATTTGANILLVCKQVTEASPFFLPSAVLEFDYRVLNPSYLKLLPEAVSTMKAVHISSGDSEFILTKDSAPDEKLSVLMQCEGPKNERLCTNIAELQEELQTWGLHGKNQETEPKFPCLSEVVDIWDAFYDGGGDVLMALYRFPREVYVGFKFSMQLFMVSTDRYLELPLEVVSSHSSNLNSDF